MCERYVMCGRCVMCQRCVPIYQWCVHVCMWEVCVWVAIATHDHTNGCSNLKVITMTTMITTTISTTTPTSTPPTAPPMAAPELAALEPVPPMRWGGEEGGRWTWW